VIAPADAHIQLPQGYADGIKTARSLRIPDLVLRDPPLQSVADYARSEPVPAGFPLPNEHFVIADYLIDLPVVAIDLSIASEHYQRVFAYTYGDYWLVADSFAEFVERLQKERDTTLWGKA
jgi:hypothetical protein